MLDRAERNVGSVQDFLLLSRVLSSAVLSVHVADTQSPAGDESRAHDGDLDLLAKHVLSVPTLDMEIQQYRCHSEYLTARMMHGILSVYPRLSMLAEPFC